MNNEVPGKRRVSRAKNLTKLTLTTISQKLFLLIDGKAMIGQSAFATEEVLCVQVVHAGPSTPRNRTSPKPKPSVRNIHWGRYVIRSDNFV